MNQIPHPEPGYFGSGDVCSNCSCAWNMAHGVANTRQAEVCKRECACHSDEWATILYEIGSVAA